MDDYGVYLKYLDLLNKCKKLELYEDTKAFNNACIAAICEERPADSTVAIMGRVWFNNLEDMEKVFGVDEVRCNSLYYCLANISCMPMDFKQRQKLREELIIRLNVLSIQGQLDIEKVLTQLSSYIFGSNYNSRFLPILGKVKDYIKLQSEHPDKLVEDIDKYSDVLLDRTHQYYNGVWYDDNEKWADNANFFFDIVKKLCAIDLVENEGNQMSYIAGLRTTDDKSSYCIRIIEDAIQEADHDNLLKIREIFEQNMHW